MENFSLFNPGPANITTDGWPSTPRCLLAAIYDLQSMDPTTVNQGILALIKARKALHDALLACRTASKEWTDRRIDVAHRLESIAADLKLMHDEQFPLEIDDDPKKRLPKMEMGVPGERAALPYHWESTSKASRGLP